MNLQTARFLAISLLGFVPMVADVCLGQDSSKDAAGASERRRLQEWPQLKGNSGFTGLSSDDTDRE